MRWGRAGHLRELHDSKSGPWGAIRHMASPRRSVPVFLCLVVLSGLGVLPVASDARPVQLLSPGDDPQSTQEQQAEVRAKRGEVAIEVDALKARTTELNAALKKLDANVKSQQAKYADAQQRVVKADEALAVATVALGEAEKRVLALEAARRQLMVDSFTSPPSENAVDAFDADNINDATIKQALLEMHADRQAEVLAQLTAAREAVKADRAAKADASAAAKRRRTSARAALARVEGAKAQQQKFADEAEAALESKLAESAQLAAVDKQLSAKLAAEQAELARRLAAAKAAADAKARAANSGSLVKPAPGGLATVSCPNGDGSITVAGSIGTQVGNLLRAAWADGVGLCGWGFRSPDEQIALRKAHCGTTYYDIYLAPASACSPPTARPGYSMHEQGLAIDFTCNGGGSIESHSSPCFIWLDNHASTYGLYNLETEAWHWSTNAH